MKPTCRISWAGNLLILSDLTSGPSWKANNGSLALVSCLSGGYKFASVLQCVDLVYLVFYVMPSTLSVILRWLVKRAEKTSTYSWSRFFTVNC